MKWFEAKWKADAFIDIWSSVHFLSGILIGVALYFLNLSPTKSYIFAFVLMVIWEIIEYFLGVGEKWYNILSDILIGMIGFATGYYYLTELRLELPFIVSLIIIIMVILEVIGWKKTLIR